MQTLQKLFVLLVLIGAIASCSDEKKNPVNPTPTDTTGISGNQEGLLKAGTYRVTGDIVVPEGKTWTLEAGVTLLFQGDGQTVATSPEIRVLGSFRSLGTKDKPVVLTVPANLATIENYDRGYWGGIQAFETSPELTIKWTKITHVGGPAGPNSYVGVYEDGDPRYAVVYNNVNGNVVIEDSYISGTSDDAVRFLGGKCSFSRNIVEMQGSTGGECVNIKSGVIGVIAYNLFIGSATNGAKTSNSGGSTVQCNVDIYNNTFVNCGYRRTKAGRGGSINIEAGARGQIYNNLIVNCRYGLRLVSGSDLPDTANTKYGNNFFYGAFPSLVADFLAATPGSVSVKQPSDILSLTPGANDPMFVNYNVTAFTEDQLRTSFSPFAAINTYSSYNFRLKTGSPAIGKGRTNFTPVLTTIPNGTIEGPSADIGCYSTDGKGLKY